MASLKDFDNADSVSIDTLALEELVLEERAKEITQLNSLSKKVCFLHTSLLYYRNSKSKVGSACYEAWRVLVKKIGGSPHGWRDLGHCLGIEKDDLDYIMNSVREDHADIVLKLFLQNETATIDNIVNAFIKLKRYDILKAIEKPLGDLALCFNKEDSGYQSNNEDKREIISFTKNLNIELPAALNKKYIIREKPPQKPNNSFPIPPPKKVVRPQKDSYTLFLTYAEDGRGTAINIQDYVHSWTEMTGVQVITLNNKREEVYENPEKYIREFFEKADFVVPILTSGYLDVIKCHEATIPCTTDNLDCKYVKFIYTLIVNNFIHATGCYNKKVRSVLPQNVDVNVIRSIPMYPDLLPWTYETEFDSYFQEFLRSIDNMPV